MKRQKKKYGRLFLRVLLVFLFSVTGSGMGWAQISSINLPFTGSTSPSGNARFAGITKGEGLRLGGITLHPFFGVGEAYTDNAFRTKVNRKSDFVHIVSPGIQAQIPFSGKRHRFVIDYKATRIWYQQFPQNDGTFQDTSGRLNFNFPTGLKLDMQVGHTDGFVTRGSPLALPSVNPTRWNTNTFIGETEFLGERGGIGLTVAATQWNFENNNQAVSRDRVNFRTALRVFRSLTPKTYGFVNFGINKTRYDKNKQSDNFQANVSAGLRLGTTGKTTGEIQGGYSVLTFDHASPNQGATGGGAQNAFTFSGNLQWKPTSRLSLKVSPSRSFRQSGTFGTSVFTQTRVSLSATQAIGARTTLNGRYGFGLDEFDEATTIGTQSGKRKDYRHSVSVGFTYKTVQWLGIAFRYSFTQRNSNFNSLDNYANSFAVGLQVLL